MASIKTSAQSSTASVFDLIGHTADAGTKLVHAATLGANMLHTKAKRLDAQVTANCKAGSVGDEEREILTSVTDYCDFMEEHFRINFPDKEFDRSKAFDEHEALIRKAFE